MGALRDMLKGVTQILDKGGRLSVITYHSLEDRIVKNVMRAGNAEGRVHQDFFGRSEGPFQLINNKVITPSDEELERELGLKHRSVIQMRHNIKKKLEQNIKQ